MYNPPAFRQTDIPTLHRLIRTRPLATLVTLADDGLTANHIPMLVDPDPQPSGTLVGHVARANSVWRADGPALAIFTGPEHYISPSWYPEKQQHGKVVPTWNYAAVHAHGTLRIHDDRDWLLNLVTRLTNTHEAHLENPWKVADAPADYIEGMLKGIVGIELRIEKLEGKWKMGQNRSEADRASAARALRNLGEKGVAALMTPDPDPNT